VEEDRLLKQLKEDLAGDFAAVKPLMKSWKRALWLFPLSLLLMEVTLAVFHLRPDHVDLGPLALWGFCSLQILASYMIFAVSLEACIPGSGRSRTFLISVGLIGLVIYLAISWFTFRVSPNWPGPGQQWHLGMACLSAIGTLGILALLFGFFLARAGLPMHARATGLLLGLGAGLAAEASWRLHCPISSWDHILLFHGGGILFLIVAGLILGSFWKRKCSLPLKSNR
jgi:hypothetical protein